MWIYHNDSSRAILFGDYQLTGTIQFNIELSTTHQVRFYWAGAPDKNFNATSSVGLQTWTHICLTYDGTILKLYKNGQLSTDTWTGPLSIKNKTSGVYYLGRDARTGTTAFNGRLNDFRIYDHCLSVAEVKEIAQGLVLHYKLNNVYLNNTTNFTSEISATAYNSALGKYGYNADSNLAKTSGTFQGKSCVKVSTIVEGQAAQPYAYFSNLFTSNDGSYPKYKKLSFEYYTTCPTTTWLNIYKLGSGEGVVYWTTVNSKGIRSGSYINSESGHNLLVEPNEWNYVEVILQNTTTASAQWGYCINGPRHTSNANYYFLYANIQLQGTDTFTIQDSSGYNHNGTTLNLCKIETESARYSNSIRLTNGDSAINCGRGGMVTDSITVNLWVKSSAWANPVSCTEGGGWNFETNGNGFRFPVYLAGVGYKATGATITPRSTICNNTWHMLTGIYDRLNQQIRVYVDSNLEYIENTESSALIGYNGSNVLWLGAEASGSATAFASNGMAGLFSDFRIYCTALVDSDIKKLYNVSMMVDKKQNVHVFEAQEATNKFSIQKNGVLNISTIYENAYQNLLQYDKNLHVEPDGSIWAHVFHHNNPANSKFTNTAGDWADGVYLDDDRWYDLDRILNSLPHWEFLHIQKLTTTAAVTKYRWTQKTNPLLATWATVAADYCQYKTATDGYNTSPYNKGMYLMKSSQLHMCIANASNGNWYGGIGVASAYNGGIPGYPNTTVTTGCIDLYIRIDTPTKILKERGMSTQQLIER